MIKLAHGKMKQKMVVKTLRSMGYDISNPRLVTFRAINSLVHTAVDNGHVTKQEFEQFFKKLLSEL